jgi:hypothetical protein
MATLEERVAALEARLDSHAMNAADLRGAIVDLRAEMNRRFEQVDVRFIAIDSRFAALEQHMNQRFGALEQQMSVRFDAVDQKIDRHFTWLVGIQVAVLVSVVGALVGSYFR